jgi:N-methylhydantoinase A
MRYLGQWRSLTVSCGSPSDAEQSDVLDKFHAEHERMYAYSSPERPAEIYNLRVVGRGIVPQPTMRPPAPVNGAPTARVTRQVFFEDADGLVEVPVIARTSLGAGAHMSGPIVISQMDSTTLLPPSWTADVASDGTLILTKQ